MSWIADLKETDYGKHLLKAGVVQIHWSVTGSSVDHALQQQIISSARYYDSHGYRIEVDDPSGMMDVTLFDFVPDNLVVPGVISIDLLTDSSAASGDGDESIDADAYLLRDYIARRADAVPAPKNMGDDPFTLHFTIQKTHDRVEPDQLKQLRLDLSRYLDWQQQAAFFKHWFPTAVKLVYKPVVIGDPSHRETSHYGMEQANIKLYARRDNELCQDIITTMDKNVYWAMLSPARQNQLAGLYTRHFEGPADFTNPDFVNYLSPSSEYMRGLWNMPVVWNRMYDADEQPWIEVDLTTPPAVLGRTNFELYLKR